MKITKTKVLIKYNKYCKIKARYYNEKNFFGLCFVLATAMSTNVFAANLMIDGKPITLDVDPTIIEGGTLVPVRAIFEELGAEVLWNNDTKKLP